MYYWKKPEKKVVYITCRVLHYICYSICGINTCKYKQDRKYGTCTRTIVLSKKAWPTFSFRNKHLKKWYVLYVIEWSLQARISVVPIRLFDKHKFLLIILQMNKKSHCWWCQEFLGKHLGGKCDGCRTAIYCNLQCKKNHWKKGSHKKECESIAEEQRRKHVKKQPKKRRNLL